MTMHCSEYHTLVRSPSGQAELRRVAEIQEWRIEKDLNSESLVISVITADGTAQSFLVASSDALDISAVLRRQVRHQTMRA